MKVGNIVRYRKGQTALMKIQKIDDLCGYRAYYGKHICGDSIMVTAANCTMATPEDLSLWNSYNRSKHANKIDG